MAKRGLKFKLIMLLAKLSGKLVCAVRKNGGTAFPGTLALKLDKHFCENFDNIPPERVIFITGSNGKSSLTSMLRHILEANGKVAAYSKKGTNLLPGITTIFINNCKLDGTPKADYFLVEADERVLPLTSGSFKGSHLVITNIMTDQVHRNGDPDYIYRIVKSVIRDDMTLYLNAHEPRSCSYGALANSRYFAVAEHSLAKHNQGMFSSTLACPVCGGGVSFEYENSSKMGEFRCRECGFCTPDKDVTLAENVSFDEASFTIGGVKFPMPYTTPIMMYNYAAAACVLTNLGLTLEQIAAGLASFVNIQGRIETVKYKDKELHYIRMKQENPETLQGALDGIAADKRPKVLVIGLCTLDERRPQWVPHYANTYYAYDCDFEDVLASNVEKTICFSRYVCSDIANRLTYDGMNADELSIIDSDRPDEVLRLVDGCECKNVYIITLLRVFEGFRDYVRKAGK